MYLADYHTHSRISPDGRDSMTALAEAAAAAGLDEICFTDHVEPIVWASTDLGGPPGGVRRRQGRHGGPDCPAPGH